MKSYSLIFIGILSILCAKAGASKVYAVEACKIAAIAKAEVRENNVEDIVTVSFWTDIWNTYVN